MTTFLYYVKIWQVGKNTLVTSFSYTRVRAEYVPILKASLRPWRQQRKPTTSHSLSGCLQELTLAPQPRQAKRSTPDQQTPEAVPPNEIPCLNVPSDLKDAIFQGLAGGVSNLSQFIKKLICLSDITDIADIANT